MFGKDVENVQETDGSSYETGGAWASKRNRVYFRGRPSNEVRVKAQASARGDPDYDIRITKNHFNYFPNDEASHGHAPCKVGWPCAVRLQNYSLARADTVGCPPTRPRCSPRVSLPSQSTHAAPRRRRARVMSDGT